MALGNQRLLLCHQRLFLQSDLVALFIFLFFAASAPAIEKPDWPKIENKQLKESSGLAFSTRTDEIVFSHNDSGDKARLFAFDRQGKNLCELEIEGASNSDWEDICSFERDDKHWLAIADVGDNDFARSSIQVYLVQEPKLKKDDGKQKTKVDLELKIKYPQGSINCEAIAYDPIADKLLLLTKETFTCRIYSVAIPDEKGKHQLKAELIGRFAIPLVTGADISRDGKLLTITTYGPVCLVPRRGGDLKSAWKVESAELEKLYVAVPLRKQGEAICFSPDSKTIWLTSEGEGSPLFKFDIPTARLP
jgi:hypothetical protein